MPEVTDGMPSPLATPAALRRCPGCHNQVSMRSPLCPVCGKNATTARVASIARWLLIVTAVVTIIWWWHHHA